MKPETTIISLIYRSPTYAINLYKYLKLVTPKLDNGQAEFYFVANGANKKTLRALLNNSIPHLIYNHKILSDKDHYELGFAAPEYIGRVYSAYNFGIKESDTEKVVLLNSDMVLSKNWLEGLLSFDDGRSAISSTLVERDHPNFGVFPGAIEKNFGRDYKTLAWDRWLDFSSLETAKETPPYLGGAYMPTLFRKEWFENFSFYPAGNLRTIEGSYSEVSEYGDQYLFRKLQENGIQHLTSPKSYCYHFKEGERSTQVLPMLQYLKAGAIRSIRRTLKHKI